MGHELFPNCVLDDDRLLALHKLRRVLKPRCGRGCGYLWIARRTLRSSWRDCGETEPSSYISRLIE